MSYYVNGVEVGGSGQWSATESIALEGAQDDLVLGTPSTVPITIVRFTGAGGIDIGSLGGQVAGRIVILANMTAAGNVILRDEAGLRGAAAKRYAAHAGVDVTVAPSGTLTVYYDGTLQRWRPLGRST